MSVTSPGQQQRWGAGSGSGAPRPLVAAAAVAGVLAALPLLYLVARVSAAEWASVTDTVWRPRTLRVTLNSVALAAAVGTSCLVIGIATAWLIVRTALPFRGLWMVLAALPLALPSYVLAYTWVATVPSMSGFTGSWLVLTLATTPYVTLPVAAALRGIDPATEEVARSLGHGTVRTFVRAVLPQLRPAAGAGTLLVVLYVLSDFGAVSIMRYDTLTRAVYASYTATFDRTRAAVMALLLVALAAASVIAERRTRNRGRSWRAASTTPRQPTLHALGRASPLVLGWLVGWASLALLVPGIALARRLVDGTRSGLDWTELFAAAWNTTWLAAFGALLALILALPVGALASRYSGRAVATVEGATYIGHALPGIVLGLSLVFLSLTVVPALYQTAAVLAFGYAVLFLPKAVGSTRVAIGQVPPALDQVARSLGRSPLAAFSGITLRLASPGIAAGALLVMLTAMKELPATIMLRPIGVDTLATELWSRTQVAAYGAAAPYAVALIVLASVPAFLLTRPGRSTSRTEESLEVPST